MVVHCGQYFWSWKENKQSWTQCVWSNVLPFFAEEDLLQDAHLAVSLCEFLCAVGPRGDQAAAQGQRLWGGPGDPLLHGVMGEPTGHLKRLPIHHQLSLRCLPKVFNLVDIHSVICTELWMWSAEYVNYWKIYDRMTQKKSSCQRRAPFYHLI